MAARFSVARSKTGGPAVDPTQCPAGVDVETFFFPSIPDEVRTLVPTLHAAPPALIQSAAAIILDYLCGSSLTYQLKPEFYDNGLSNEDSNGLLTAIYFIARTALRNKVKLSVIRGDLEKMNVPTVVADALCEQIRAQRNNYEDRVIHHRLHFPQLQKLRWRVDVVISSGSLTRVMRPNILLQMITKDGRIVTYEVSLEMFHTLRYSVAKVLHEMQSLERHPIIRIVNEFKRREEEDYNK